MESPDDRQMDGLSQAQQEVIAEAELQRFKKRQRLLDCARGKNTHPLFIGGVLLIPCMVAYYFAIRHIKTPPKAELVFAISALLITLAIIFRLNYVERRLNALLELFEEDSKPKEKHSPGNDD